MRNITVCAFLSFTLAACSGSEAPTAPTAEPAVAETIKPDFVGQGTAMDPEFKALDDAKKVEQQTLDAAEKAREQMDQ